MGEIIRGNYPELDKVLWDFHTQKIPAMLAFRMYEERWNLKNKNRQRLIFVLVKHCKKLNSLLSIDEAFHMNYQVVNDNVF